jgi:hypothetical protein
MSSHVVQPNLSDLIKNVDAYRDNPRDAYLYVQETIKNLKEAEREVPTELLLIERDLSAECCAESQGR